MEVTVKDVRPGDYVLTTRGARRVRDVRNGYIYLVQHPAIRPATLTLIITNGRGQRVFKL